MFAEFLMAAGLSVGAPANNPQVNQAIPAVENQVKIELAAANFDFTAAQTGGEDVRFTDTDQITLLDHWIETWDAGAEQAVLWVAVPDVAAGATRTIYLYHDNALAPTTSDGIATFEFFDSFEEFGGGGCDMNAPTYLTTPTYDGSGQVVHPDVLHVPGGWNGIVL